MNEQEGGFNWWKGCGIGCAVIILLLVVAAVGGYFFVMRTVNIAGEAMKDDFSRAYPKLKEEGKIPDEHVELYDSLFEISQSEQTGFVGFGAIIGAMMLSLEDNAVEEEEVEMLNEIKLFFEKNPSPNLMEIGKFVEKHPELKTRFEHMQKKQNAFKFEPNDSKETATP